MANNHIKQLQLLCTVTRDQAIQLLDKANGNVDIAADRYFGLWDQNTQFPVNQLNNSNSPNNKNHINHDNDSDVEIIEIDSEQSDASPISISPVPQLPLFFSPSSSPPASLCSTNSVSVNSLNSSNSSEIENKNEDILIDPNDKSDIVPPELQIDNYISKSASVWLPASAASYYDKNKKRKFINELKRLDNRSTSDFYTDSKAAKASITDEKILKNLNEILFGQFSIRITYDTSLQHLYDKMMNPLLFEWLCQYCDTYSIEFFGANQLISGAKAFSHKSISSGFKFILEDKTINDISKSDYCKCYRKEKKEDTNCEPNWCPHRHFQRTVINVNCKVLFDYANVSPTNTIPYGNLLISQFLPDQWKSITCIMKGINDDQQYPSMSDILNFAVRNQFHLKKQIELARIPLNQIRLEQQKDSKHCNIVLQNSVHDDNFDVERSAIIDIISRNQYIDPNDITEQSFSQMCGLNVTLRDYQVQSVLWMYGQELMGNINQHFWHNLQADFQSLWYNPCLQRFSKMTPEHLSDIRGGLLCQAMGLGKTISVIALINLNPANFTAPKPSINDYKSAIVGLAGQRFPAQNNVRPHYIDSRATLIIAPVSLIGQWTDEIRKRSNRKLKILQWHGSNRAKDLMKIADNDIVLTTGGTVSTSIQPRFDYKAGRSLPAFCPMDHIRFHRIVIDEGHSLKNLTSSQSRTWMYLISSRRWILTGTPFQSSTSDIIGQMKFLGVSIFDETWIAAAMRDYDKFDKSQNPPSHMSCGGVSIFDVLRHIMKMCCMRHVGDTPFNDRQQLLTLPAKQEETVYVELSTDQREVYRRLHTHARAQFDFALKLGFAVTKVIQMMALLIPLRQACSGATVELGQDQRLNQQSKEQCSQNLVDADVQKAAVAVDEPFNLNGGECVVCLEILDEPLMTACRHIFCGQCILEIANSTIQRCPLCREIVKPEQLRAPPNLSNNVQQPAMQVDNVNNGNALVFDAKLNLLITHLNLLRSSDPNAKVLIFTQFTRTMIWLRGGLSSRQSRPVLSISGDMTLNKRKKMLSQFNDDPQSTLFLLSVRSGAVGLTLTAANHVYMFEPCLNTALTAQAINRVYRIGQTKPVHVHHLIVNNSVESQIWKLNAIKLGDSQNSSETSSSAASIKKGSLNSDVANLRLDELKLLFESN